MAKYYNLSSPANNSLALFSTASTNKQLVISILCFNNTITGYYRPNANASLQYTNGYKSYHVDSVGNPDSFMYTFFAPLQVTCSPTSVLSHLESIVFERQLLIGISAPISTNACVKLFVSSAALSLMIPMSAMIHDAFIIDRQKYLIASSDFDMAPLNAAYERQQLLHSSNELVRFVGTRLNVTTLGKFQHAITFQGKTYLLDVDALLATDCFVVTILALDIYACTCTVSKTM